MVAMVRRASAAAILRIVRSPLVVTHCGRLLRFDVDCVKRRYLRASMLVFTNLIVLVSTSTSFFRGRGFYAAMP